MPIRIPFEPSAIGNYIHDVLDEVEKTVKRIRYNRLKKELIQGANPEINTDRQVLLWRMEQLGFRGEILDALRELDRRLAAAGKPLDFKTCMDIARTVYEEIIEDAARKAAALTNTALPTGKLKDFQPWKDLLVNAKVLTFEEGDLFQKLYNYLSNVGSHRLGSEQEHVRIARNTVIEWGLLLVGRVQALTAKPAAAS